METYNNDQNKFQNLFTKLSLKSLPVICLVLIFIFTALNYFSSNNTISTISVTGSADITAKPDSVKFVVTSINTTNDIPQGITIGEANINKLIAITKELGGSDVEIKKTFYQITSQTSSHTIANAFSVKTSKMENLDTLIKKLYSSGANTITNVVFESDDINNVETKLRQKVFDNAKEKAIRIAKSAHKNLGKIISITDDTTNNTSTIKDLQTNDGLINISKSISVIYQIK